MRSNTFTGNGHSDLSLVYALHKKGEFTIKDAQVFVSEFLGTFFLALIIGASKVSSSNVTALTIGFAFVSILYIFGPLSGAQVNPAVTLAVLIRNKISIFEAVYHIVSQVIGAVFAALVTYALYNDNWTTVGYPSIDDGYPKSRAFVAEMIQTFALALTVLNTATTKNQANNSYYGVAIGFVVLSGAIVQASDSGSCYNPAVAMLTLMAGDFEDFWVFVAGPMTGGFLAGLLFRLLNPDEVDAADPYKKLSLCFFYPNLYVYKKSWIPIFVANLLMEFIGTFFLCLTIALTANVSDGDGYIAVGCILVSMVYAGGAVSGGHFNPAISLGVYFRRYVFVGVRDEDYLWQACKVGFYCSVQIIGGFCGGGTAAYFMQGTILIASPAINTAHHTVFAGFVVEFLFALLLVLSVLTTATLPKVHGNSYFGMAIGFVVLAGIATVADISGGAFNPAVGIALPSIKNDHTSDIWVYVLAPALGAIAAAGLFAFFSIELEDPFADAYVDDAAIAYKMKTKLPVFEEGGDDDEEEGSEPTMERGRAMSVAMSDIVTNDMVVREVEEAGPNNVRTVLPDDVVKEVEEEKEINQ